LQDYSTYVTDVFHMHKFPSSVFILRLNSIFFNYASIANDMLFEEKNLRLMEIINLN